MNCREWLAQWHYQAELDKIERVEAILRKKGNRTRRSWWEAFAGRPSGQPRIIEGVEFPIIAAIQKREYGMVTPDATQKDRREVAPQKLAQPRWGSRRPKRHRLKELPDRK